MKRIVEVLDKLDWMVNGAVWPKMTDSARDERRQWLCGLFRWALEEGYSDVNPAASFEGRKAVAKRKKGELSRQERQSFSDEQLRKIFSKERFVTGGRESTHKNGIIYPFEYWLPLLALYAGLRIEEAAQLHLDDIACRDGIWILKINSNGEKSLKNDNAAREIPIHPELIRLGLLRYRDRLCDEGYLRLFPELTYEKGPGYSGTASNKFTKLFASFGWPRDGTLVYHCFRHNANNAIMKVDSSILGGGGDQYKQVLQYKIMGHDLGSDTNKNHYTDDSIVDKAALIGGISYDLPHIERFNENFGAMQVRKALQRKKSVGKDRESIGLDDWRIPEPKVAREG
jgi:integrase